jgi:hypothetical protein
MELVTRNANTLFEDMFWKFKVCGQPVDTRNGPAIRIPEPVLTTVTHPAERVLFCSERDANPIFHVLEALWMLAGRRDVEFLQMFNSRIGQYSDDGETFNAAYGHRMRHYFDTDQLLDVIEKLRSDPETRQAVVQLWSALDLSKKTLDKACNMSLVFEIQGDRLNMTVINRSNDAWYGYAGANIVHMTMIQEFVACALGVKLGLYRTFSTNLHIYTELYDASKLLVQPPASEFYDHYANGSVNAKPLIKSENPYGFLGDCERFCQDPFNDKVEYRYSFLNDVAVPMAKVSEARKQGKSGVEFAAKIEASDWRRATYDWIHRRELKKQSLTKV